MWQNGMIVIIFDLRERALRYIAPLYKPSIR